ncbi:MAG: OB-fold nucleic acid binding domain-containing protein, partial [Cyclobacteriaceae bacterium]|nr:OB-fold nucleic acid binding domain-containing protein [Cyclobacteriaceae bacterium]
MQRVKINEVLKGSLLSQDIHVKGWVRTFRSNRFINLNDGSCAANLQLVIDFEQYPDELLKKITTGACIHVHGTVVESLGKGQSVELSVKEVEILGVADPEKYPLQPKKHSLEFLREIAHLRARTNTFGAIYRIRHAMIFATHKFFNDKGFLNIHTPIITGSDAEGAGEMFRVTTLDLNNIPRTEEG